MAKLSESQSRYDYIVQLEKKCETGFPQTIEEIEKEMETLRRFQSQLLAERKDVSMEMEYLKKSLDNTEINLLMDLPETVWLKVIGLCKATQNNSLWNACLASKNLEEKIFQNCPNVKEELIGRNSFSVLVRDYYLDRDDLLNCLNSKCQILEDSAAASWRYLKNTVAGSKITFEDSKAIFNFMEEVKGKENPWEMFNWKLFEFDGAKLSTRDEQKEFLNGLKKLMGEFGKFIFCLRTQDMEWMGTEKNFFQNLFCTMPNIQSFQDYHGGAHSGGGPFHSLYNRAEKINPRNLEPFFEICPERRNKTFFKATVTNCSNLRLYLVSDFYTLEAEKSFYRNIKILEIDTDYFNNPSYQRFLATDLSVFCNLEQLVLDGTEERHVSLPLALLTKFPRVRDVSLVCRRCSLPPVSNPPPRESFEFVRKLTFEFRYGHPPPLDDIPEALPSLRYFCLKTKWSKLKLKNMLAKYISEGLFENYVIDLYDFYAEARPLSGSNIWQHMTRLKTLVVETTASYLNWERFPANEMLEGTYTKRREIYTRDEENVIKMQESVLPH